MRKKLAALSVGVLLGTMLTGCMEKHGEIGNKDIRSNSIRYDANGNLLKDKRFANDQKNEMNRLNGRRLNSNNVIGSHKNYRMEISHEAANKIMAMGDVKSAYVMMTDSNAYVAVSFDEHAAGVESKMLSRTNSGYLGKEGTRVSRKMSTLSTGEHMLTAEMKDKIAREVKHAKPTVGHVYISASPDFVGRMTSYMNDAKLGHPLQSYIAEFNAMAERVFPAKSSDNDIKILNTKDRTYIYD